MLVQRFATKTLYTRARATDGSTMLAPMSPGAGKVLILGHSTGRSDDETVENSGKVVHGTNSEERTRRDQGDRRLRFNPEPQPSASRTSSSHQGRPLRGGLEPAPGEGAAVGGLLEAHLFLRDTTGPGDVA